MPNLTPFWRMLETRTSRTAVMAEWQRVAGEYFPVVQQVLQPTEHLATVYPSSKGGLRVVHHVDGSIVGVHEGDWETRQNLTREDIVLYRADLSKLRKVVSDALTCVQISRTPIDTTSSRIQIGNWEPKKAAAFPVHLLLCRQRADLRRDVLGIMVDGRKPGAILLTPTRANWDDEIDALARGQNMLLVPLADVLTAVNGAFVETPAWDEYLQTFCQMVKLTLPGNYRNKKAAPMRGTRVSNIEKLEKELEGHLLAARDHAQSRVDDGLEPTLLPKPTQTELGKRVGLIPSDVSRCLNDKRAILLKILWETADSLQAVMRYKRRL
jgi:hypothetical protein